MTVRVLVFGAHPDDIEIGMGGTVARHVEAGDRVVMAIATVPGGRANRRREAERGAAVLGASLRLLDIPPEELGHSRPVIARFDELLGSVEPDLVYTHWNEDSHQDHNAVARATITACRKNTCSLLMYEQTIPGGVVPEGFKAQCFVDVTPFIDRKIESILAHGTQIEANGRWWLQGVKGRAMYRGYQINVQYAEAFEVVKEINSHFRWRNG